MLRLVGTGGGRACWPCLDADGPGSNPYGRHAGLAEAAKQHVGLAVAGTRENLPVVDDITCPAAAQPPLLDPDVVLGQMLGKMPYRMKVGAMRQAVLDIGLDGGDSMGRAALLEVLRAWRRDALQAIRDYNITSDDIAVSMHKSTCWLRQMYFDGCVACSAYDIAKALILMCAVTSAALVRAVAPKAVKRPKRK